MKSHLFWLQLVCIPDFQLSELCLLTLPAVDTHSTCQLNKLQHGNVQLHELAREMLHVCRAWKLAPRKCLKGLKQQTELLLEL